MKIKKIAVAILALACCALPACKKAEATSTQINGFENYDEIRSVLLEGGVGSFDTNTDSAYITEGSGSLKFTLSRTSALANEGWVLSSTATGEAYAKNVTASLVFTPKLEYNQLSKLNAFSVDIYNANDYDAQVVLYATDAEGNVTFSSIKNLAKNGWNNVCFPLNGLFYENATKLVSRYRLAFVGKNVNETYYVDNFTAELGNGGVKNAVQAEGNGKLLSFNKASDVDACNLITYTQTPAVNAYYSANPDFSQTGGSLCLEMMPYSGTQAQRSAGTQSATAKGSGVEFHKDVLSGLSKDSALLLDACLAGANEKRVNITISDGKASETLTFTLASETWQTLSVTSEKVDLSKLSSLVVTVDTTENSERVKIYLDDLRYE